MKLLITQFSPVPVTSSLWGPNIPLRLCSSLNARGQVSHPYRTKGKIMVFIIIIIILQSWSS
jgi:hypothetical protein